MNLIKDIPASLLMLVGLILTVNGCKRFMTIDYSTMAYILKYWFLGITCIGFGFVIKEYIKL